jgi:DNA-binding transcriptional ArsR family regulator
MAEFVHVAMPAAQPFTVRVLAGAAFETLFGVSALTRDDAAPPRNRTLRAAIEAVGPRSSELWLHLLGLALDDPDDVVAAVRATRPVELRRHLAGVHVPAWRSILGVEALEATARGDARWLDHERYYAGRGSASLERILPLSATETKRRILDVLELFRDTLLDADVVAGLEREAESKRRLDLPPHELIALASPGYHYEPEPELPDVVLVPHAAARPWLLLCQHERSRLICYPLPEPQETEDRIVAFGRALGDEKRVRMLVRLSAGRATLAELAATADVAKSTAHHHLALLRAAALVEQHGNAQGYWFELSRRGLASGRRLLSVLN